MASPHVVEQGCELLGGALGLSLQPGPVTLPMDAAAERRCEEALALSGVNNNEFVLLAPQAGWGAKQWPAERYGEVAARLCRNGVRVVVNAASTNDATAGAVVAASGGRAAVVPCDLAELIALTRRAALVIAGDTGPLHLAAALEKPVVALFGPTDPKRNGPYGTRAVVLRHGGERRDHRRLAEPEAGLLEITADEVVEGALRLLDS